jgi:hypothetical protein
MPTKAGIQKIWIQKTEKILKVGSGFPRTRE